MTEIIELDDYRVDYENLRGLVAEVDEDGLMTFRPATEDDE